MEGHYNIDDYIKTGEMNPNFLGETEEKEIPLSGASDTVFKKIEENSKENIDHIHKEKGKKEKGKLTFFIIAVIVIIIVAVITITCLLLRNKKKDKVEELKEKAEDLLISGKEKAEEIIQNAGVIKEEKTWKKATTIISGVISVALIITLSLYFYFDNRRK